MSKSKYYVFTLNNYTSSEEEALKVDNNDITYIVFGKEVGESGTPHLQGYLELRIRKTMAQVHRLTGVPRLSFQRRKGNSKQAAQYCKKDGQVYERGAISISIQGKRSDLEAALDSVREGASLRELWQEHTSVMVRYEGGIRRARIALQAPAVQARYQLSDFGWTPPQNIQSLILWGETGIGKTQFALALMPTALLVTHMDDLINLDPTVHEGVVFDDMDFRHLPRTAQIQLTDWEVERSIHVRYTTATIPMETRKIFTTNNCQGEIFLNDPAINRRIKTIELIKW